MIPDALKIDDMLKISNDAPKTDDMLKIALYQRL